MPKHAARFVSAPEYIRAIRWDGEKDTLESIDEMLPTNWWLLMTTGPENDRTLYVNVGNEDEYRLVRVPLKFWVVAVEDEVMSYRVVEDSDFRNKYDLVED